MAPEALIDTCVGDTRDRLRHHLEVHHVMTRRRLVTLDAVGRSRRWMLEIRNGPRGRPVARRTIVTE